MSTHQNSVSFFSSPDFFFFFHTDQEQDLGQNNLEEEGTSREPIKKRVLRSERATPTRPMNRRHMFPDKCVLCNTDKTRLDRKTGKRRRIQLSQCEQIDGGQLVQAAPWQHAWKRTRICYIKSRDKTWLLGNFNTILTATGHTHDSYSSPVLESPWS